MMGFKWFVLVASILAFMGCASMRNNPSTPDQVAQAFFDDLQRSDTQAAYHLFAQGLSQRVSFDQFDEFMKTLRQHWGMIDTEETVLLPFHQRAGEKEFIPLGIKPQRVKRYTFDVHYDSAEMNFDLTIVPQQGVYRIVWFSIWGSSIYMHPEIQEKIEKLFSKDDQSQAGQ